MAGTYTLPDEPKPTAMARMSTNPVWPLLAMMFAGTWLALPWFAFNAWAFGSPGRERETAIALGGIVALFVTLFCIFAAIGGGVPKWTIPYLMMLLTLEKLALAYWLYQLQVGAFSIHAYYGGAHFNGLYLMLLGGFILRPYVAKLVDVHVFFVALM